MKKRLLKLSGILFTSLALGAAILTSQAYAQTPAAAVGIQVYAHLTITGAVGSNYLVQCVGDMSQSNGWNLLATVLLLSSPYEWVDKSAPAMGQRFYRVIAAPEGTNTASANPNPDLVVWIPPGTFTMGAPVTESERWDDETPHRVTLTKGFYMSKYLVRQWEYWALIGSNPSSFTGNTNLPVEQVNWSDATNYCAKLTLAEQAAGRLPAGWVYRLPTESEFEYACRAGTTTAFYFGGAIHGGMANFNSYYEYDVSTGDISVSDPVGHVGQTTPVGNYAPNPWGLYDMCGNVYEWCQDLYASYPIGSVTDPTGGATGSNHVLRGGCWGSKGQYLRAAVRYGYSHPSNWIGFRVVLAPGQPY